MMMYHHHPNIVNKPTYVFELSIEIFLLAQQLQWILKIFSWFIYWWVTFHSSYSGLSFFCSQILHFLQCLDKTWTSKHFPSLTAVTTPFSEECPHFLLWTINLPFTIYQTSISKNKRNIMCFDTNFNRSFCRAFIGDIFTLKSSSLMAW